jgi:replication factor A1
MHHLLTYFFPVMDTDIMVLDQEQQSPNIPLIDISNDETGITLIGRVKSKTPVEKTGNGGQRFTFDLQDENGTMCVVAFNQAVDKFFNRIEVGEWYTISRARIGRADQRYSAHKDEYVINFNSVVEEADDNKIRAHAHEAVREHVKLEKIPELAVGDVVNVMCIIAKDRGVGITSARKYKKREITLMDETGEAKLVLWGEKADTFKGKVHDSAVIVNLKRSEYNGEPYLTTTNSFTMELNPDRKSLYTILGWYVTQQRKENANAPNGNGDAGVDALMQ